MIFATFVLSALLGVAAASTERVSYKDHLVLRCTPETRTQLDFLHDLETKENDLDLDFWLETQNVKVPVDIMVSKQKLPALETMLLAHGVPCKTMMSDVHAQIQREASLHMNTKDASFFESYHDWQSVQDYVEGLATEFPSLAKTSTIGNTYYGKPMKIITFSTGSSSNKPVLWFDGGLHAREWITVATVTYLADFIARGYGNNANATYLLDTYDVIICPILNVDGYDYTWTTDRMWRKTLSPTSNPKCNGVDPNRNWNFHWGEAGASPMTCSDSYQGPSPASEIEVQNVQNYLYAHKSSIVGYINFHSYSQEWMSNWGYTADLPPDYETQNALSAAAVAAIKATHGTVYTYGPISTTVYPASGSSADYTYGVCGIKYSYGVELRDTGEFGFLLPPAQIIPSGEETWAAIIAMAQYIEANP